VIGDDGIARFHATEGRTLRIVQITAPNPCCWAVYYDPADDPISASRGGRIDWRPVACIALVEWDAGHGPEQDLVPFVAAETGEYEPATESADYAGMTYDFSLIQQRSTDPRTAPKETLRIIAFWKGRWEKRNRANEVIAETPPPDIGPYQGEVSE
jgi:hypothetical protein